MVEINVVCVSHTEPVEVCGQAIAHSSSIAGLRVTTRTLRKSNPLFALIMEGVPKLVEGKMIHSNPNFCFCINSIREAARGLI